jgi:quercetin 2,3-dioxygenase
MIDHFGPTVIMPGGNGGLNLHPHRGFETVTLLFDGAMEHQDSQGDHGVLRPGDVQWMTAARGIVHAEYHEQGFARRGGTLYGIQLWVNLPARDKMNPPGYQDIASQRIPEVRLDAGVERVVAADFQGVRGPARTRTPMLVMLVRLIAGGVVEVPVPGAGTRSLMLSPVVLEGRTWCCATVRWPSSAPARHPSSCLRSRTQMW